MNTQNLLPAGPATRLQRRRAMRRWSRIVGGYSIALMLASVGLWFASDSHEAVSLRVNDQPNISSLNVKLAALRKQNTAVQEERQFANSLANRPDWSILLARLADSLGDGVVLNEVTLEPQGPARSVRLGGFARSAAEVTGLILRIEQLQFFSNVQLTQSAPQSLSGRPATGFTLQCTLPIAEGSAK